MTALWLAAFALPLAVAGGIALAGLAPHDSARRARDRLARYSWIAALPAGLLALVGDSAERSVPWLLFGASVGLDDVGRPLTALAAAVYGLALAFVPRGTDRRPALLASLVLVCFVGNVGLFVAADTVTFYLGFTLMSFTGAALVIHDRSARALRAGRIYLVMTVLGEGAVLAAAVLTVRAGGARIADAAAAVAGADERDLVVGLLVAGFGVKAGTVPLHVWLPLAHPAAPTPASAILSGVMLKAGLVGWLRFLPLGEGQAAPGWGALLLALALIGGFLSVPVGLLQDDPKVVLAYSSISQMGFLAALVGVALAVPELAEACVLAAVVYAVHHGCTKAALFLGVQMWQVERWPRWAVATVLGIAGLSLVGAPFTSGYVAKYGAKEAVGEATVDWAGGVPVAEVLPWVGVGSTLLLVRFAVVVWRKDRERHATPVTRDLAWAALAVAPVWPVAQLASALAPQAVPEWLGASTVWDQSWPLLLGIAVAAPVAWAAAARRWRESRLLHPRGDVVPPGDVVEIEERAVRAVGRRLSAAIHWSDRGARRLRALVRRTPSPLPLVARWQAGLGTWAGSGAVLLLLLTAAVLWAVPGIGGP